jgi:hypothetical protein
MFRNILVPMTILSAVACSSTVTNQEIKTDASAGTVVDGIPYRIPKRFAAAIYEKGANGYVQIAELPVTIPDPDHIYVLGFKSKAFNTSKLDITLNDDNTLQKVALTSASTGSAALSAAGTQLSAIAAAEKARQTAGTAAETAAATLSIAADKLKQAADLATLQYELLKANPLATAEDLLKAAQKERSAKLDANEAARLAGKPPYFPDVTP